VAQQYGEMTTAMMMKLQAISSFSYSIIELVAGDVTVFELGLDTT